VLEAVSPYCPCVGVPERGYGRTLAAAARGIQDSHGKGTFLAGRIRMSSPRATWLVSFESRPRTKKLAVWSVPEARKFLASPRRRDGDALYAGSARSDL
jgi:hypothetical protein